MTKDQALEKKAENARELGLNYEPDWTPEEEEAFNMVENNSNLGKQILRANKSSGMDCCTYDCVQGRDCPVRQAKWVGLSKEETEKLVGDDKYTKLISSVVAVVETLLRRKNT
jgi:hypothetical protein